MNDRLPSAGPYGYTPLFQTSVNGSEEPSGLASDHNTPSAPVDMPFEMPHVQFQPRAENAGATSYELLGLGLFEALPPTKMIEEL